MDTKNKIISLLQQYEKDLPVEQHGNLKIPYGVIRSVDEILPEYKFVSDHTIQRNIAYAVEALDFFRWLINRFKTYGPVRGYQYKVGLILVDMILEALTGDFLEQLEVPQAKKYSKNIGKLNLTSVPSKHIDWMEKVHTRRSNIHLHLISDLEAVKYKMSDWNDSIKCLHATKKIFQDVLDDFIKNKLMHTSG